MCRSDEFTGAELQQLWRHPLLRPLLSRLVLIGERGIGYPDREGKALRRPGRKPETVRKDDRLRIAHPHDLMQAGDWPSWQRECFESGRVQPFKQVFRELYVVTEQEKKDGHASRRYAGQQVNQGQAQALFGARLWQTQEQIHKTFHEAGLVAEMSLHWGGGTPLAVEGWTLDTVSFRRRDSYEPVALGNVPPRIFSEVMRDLDLVVSVAHRGEVDPEASASTVEMRKALLRETCALLGLANLEIQGNHVLIAGSLTRYTVHLGSGTAHRLPGGAVCIVPVHSQHRGRLFLPFADDDPRTAEVLAKVLLLARDHEIQDPVILEQIRGRLGCETSG